MLLAQWLGAEVRMVRNEVHAFCELRCNDGSWRRVELGGGRMEDKATKKRNEEAKQWLTKLATSPNSEPIDSRADFYEDQIRQWAKQRPVFDPKANAEWFLQTSQL